MEIKMRQNRPVSEKYFCPKLNTLVTLNGVTTTNKGKTWLAEFDCSHCCQACGVRSNDSDNCSFNWSVCSKQPNLSINGFR